MKPLGVVAVAILALYSQQPPSVLKPGRFISVGGAGLASCSFLPPPLRAGYCDPLRATVTETGSLVVFRGESNAVPVVTRAGVLEDESKGTQVLFSSPVPRWRRFEVSEGARRKRGEWRGEETVAYLCRFHGPGIDMCLVPRPLSTYATDD